MGLTVNKEIFKYHNNIIKCLIKEAKAFAYYNNKIKQSDTSKTLFYVTNVLSGKDNNTNTYPTSVSKEALPKLLETHEKVSSIRKNLHMRSHGSPLFQTFAGVTFFSTFTPVTEDKVNVIIKSSHQTPVNLIKFHPIWSSLTLISFYLVLPLLSMIHYYQERFHIVSSMQLI